MLAGLTQEERGKLTLNILNLQYIFSQLADQHDQTTPPIYHNIPLFLHLVTNSLP